MSSLAHSTAEQHLSAPDSTPSGPFAGSAPLYRAKGWPGTLPLPKDKKDPPPTGWTAGPGLSADGRCRYPDDAKVGFWRKNRPNGNICLRLGEITIDGQQFEIVGIDVDHYMKGGKRKSGGDTLAGLEAQLGPLPATWASGARSDGTSGTRYFLVPAGLHLRDDLKDIDVIWKGQRYAIVWPSTNPDNDNALYRWYPPGQAPDGIGWVDEIPSAAELPTLSDAWVDYLTKSREPFVVEDVDFSIPADALYDWADAVLLDGEAMCQRMRIAVDGRKVKIAEDSASHQPMRDVHWEVLRLAGLDGHTGWVAACNEIEKFWAEDVAKRGKRPFDVLLGEVRRSRTGALRKLKGRVEARGPVRKCVCHMIYDTDDDVNAVVLHLDSLRGKPKVTAPQQNTATGSASTANPNDQTPKDDATRRRNAPLDLRRLRTDPPKPVKWLLPDVVPSDSYVSLSSHAGVGKSILARALAVDASIGRSAIDPAETVEPAKVIYLDAENGEDWWRDGLDAMGAPLDLPNLTVVPFPDLAGLDTDKGALEFLKLIIDLAAGMNGEVDLVVLDTVSRFVDGGENDADTWSQFYRRAIAPLRDQHVAVLRLDHLGKDAARGPRGSSHKLSDVDADYRLTADKPGGDDLTLTLGKRRRQHFAESMSLRRLDGPLRHEPGGPLSLGVTLASGQVVPVHPKVAALVADLDLFAIDVMLSRPKAQVAYNAVGGSVKASASVWSAAIKFRRAVQNGGQQTA